MTAQADFIQFLLDQKNVEDFVDGRIRPKKLEQSDPLPAIVVKFIGGPSGQHLGGLSGMRRSTVQVDCYHATSSDDAEKLADAALPRIVNMRGKHYGTFFHAVESQNRLSGYEKPKDQSDRGKHRVTLDFLVTHSEATQ